MSDFEPYEFKEYPKWVETAKGESVIVNDKEEEAALLIKKRGRKPNSERNSDFVDDNSTEDAEALTQEVKA